MSYALEVGTIISTKLFCHDGDQLAMNDWYWRVSALTGSGRDLRQATQSVNATFQALYVAILNESSLWLGVKGSVMNEIPMPASEIVNDFVAGVVTGDLLPRQVTATITWKTAFAGRAYRGRSYMPFPSESHNTGDQQVDGAYVGDLAAIAVLRLTPLVVVDGANSVTLQPILWNREGLTFTPLVDYQIKGLWATQSRRGDYGRVNAAVIS